MRILRIPVVPLSLFIFFRLFPPCSVSLVRKRPGLGRFIAGVCRPTTSFSKADSEITSATLLLLSSSSSNPTQRTTLAFRTSVLNLAIPSAYKMTTTTMHFGPEWMRKAPSRANPSPPLATPTTTGASSYSALVAPATHAPPEKPDLSNPFRYSKEDMIRIYKEGGGKGGLGLEVERWEGIVRELGSDPIALKEMSEAEKKVRIQSNPCICDVVALQNWYRCLLAL